MRFVPALLKPLDFWHSDEALFLVQRLEQTSNDWQNLALATSGYQSWKNANPWSSIEKYIAVCLAKRELLVFKINPVSVKIERLQFNNPYGLSYRFLPAYYRLTHSALPLKRITDLTKAHSLVQSLNLSDKQFNELIETLSISPPESTNTAKPIDLLCRAIISGAVIIHEREAFTTSKPLVEEPLGPNDRPSTMGVEPYDPAKAYQEKQAKANQPIPLSARKGLPPASLDDVVPNKLGDLSSASNYTNLVSKFKGSSSKEIQGFYSQMDNLGIDYKKLVNGAINKYGMTPDEAHAVFGYTTKLFYRDLNHTLANGGTPEALELASLIKSGLNKMPSIGVKQYRGIRLEGDAAIKAFDSQFKLGNMVESNFWSTAPNANDAYAGTRNLLIETNSARDISELAFGVNFHQKVGKPVYSSETIIPPGVKFKVMGVDQNGRIILREM